MGQCLGEGVFAIVYKAVDRTPDRLPWAMKIMAYPSGKNKKQVNKLIKYMDNEIHSMVTLKHPNIVRCANKTEQEKYPFRGKEQKIIIMQLEFYPNGDIFEILFYTGKPFSSCVVRTFYVQLMDAMDSCHKKGIVHRDIKLQNFFLDRFYCLKLGDFGLAKVFADSGTGIDKRERMDTYWAGTKGYQCPEMLRKIPYTQSCDIFSCGVALFIMLTGYPPFEEAKKKDHWYSALARSGESGTRDGPNFKKFWRKHGSAPRTLRDDPECQDLLNNTLAYNPKYRMNIRDIMNHPFITRKPMLIGKELTREVAPHRQRALEAKKRKKG